MNARAFKSTHAKMRNNKRGDATVRLRRLADDDDCVRNYFWDNSGSFLSLSITMYIGFLSWRQRIETQIILAPYKDCI